MIYPHLFFSLYFSLKKFRHWIYKGMRFSLTRTCPISTSHSHFNSSFIGVISHVTSSPELQLVCTLPTPPTPLAILTYHPSPSSKYAILFSTMCEYTRNYYIYTSCIDPGAHYFSTSIDGSKERQCAKGPHERYIVVPGHCPLCS